jgi:hypothetical protein
MGKTTAALGAYSSDLSYLAWMTVASMGAAVAPYEWNFGVSSETIAQIAARIGSVTGLSPKPDYCVVLAGMNDLLASTPATPEAMATAVDTTILQPLIAAGITPIVMGVPPALSLSTAMNSKRLEYNRFLSALPTIYCPSAERVQAQFGETATYDGIHPNAAAHHVMGKALAATILTFATPATALSSLGEIATTGTGGGTASGGIGAPPTGWTIENAPLAADGRSISGRIQPNGTGSLRSGLNPLTGVVGGEKAFIDFDCGWAGVDLQRVLFKVGFYTSGGGFLGETYALGSLYASPFSQSAAGVVRVGPVTVPATATQIAASIDFQAPASKQAVLRRFVLNSVKHYKYA